MPGGDEPFDKSQDRPCPTTASLPQGVPGRGINPSPTKGPSMDISTARLVGIDEEIRNSYLDCAMSVIVAQALPDACDGLKPVHRRTL